MKIKAKKTYKDLDNTENFISLGSTSTHLKLLAGLEVDWNKDLPKDLKDHLTTKNSKKGDK